MKVLVIGGGIMGLSSALYLRQAGWDVTVLDKGDFSDNCSYGNAGYICPSHFIPLATPGNVRKGLRWMWNSRSPFYVQPRLNTSLFRWGYRFLQSARPEKVANAAIPLRDIALLSQAEYAAWQTAPGLSFSYEHKGLLEIFQTEEGAAHAQHTLKQAEELGLEGTRLLSREELQALEPQTRIEAAGALFFACDAHCYPNRLMQQLRAYLEASGVELVPGAEVRGFDLANGRVARAYSGDRVFEADEWVLATGSWSEAIAAKLSLRIPVMPGRGYSLTLEDPAYRINYPSILVEGRVALTPMDGNKTRFGGTMEITSHRTPPRMNRVQGILDSVKRYFPDFRIPFPAADKIWNGYRPCSPDGLPYIGRVNQIRNLTIATGHAMLGLSLGAGTGKLVAEIIGGQPLSMDTTPFAPDRFQ